MTAIVGDLILGFMPLVDKITSSGSRLPQESQIQSTPSEKMKIPNMATHFAASVVLSTATTAADTSTTTTTSPASPRPLIKPYFPPSKHLSTTLIATATATSLLSSPSPSLTDSPTFHPYYGTVPSAANYGGYGSNESKKDLTEYIYEVPDGWKERLISKVKKGTNGTGSECYNPKKCTKCVHLTFLSGSAPSPSLALVCAMSKAAWWHAAQGNMA